MKMILLTSAEALPDRELLARLESLAGREREATVELLAHLAALDARPAAYLAAGYGSLFGYCTQALRLSEDAACNRIEGARACRRFPAILDLLASGEVTLTAVRRLGKYLTPESHATILGRARRATRDQIDGLVAELDPRPDVRSLVRRLPTPAPTTPEPLSEASLLQRPATTVMATMEVLMPTDVPDGPEAPTLASPLQAPPPPRPVVQATSPGRYRVQFTIAEATHDKLRRLQALLRREIPDGDPGAIFDRAASVLLERIEKTKLGAPVKPGKPRPIRSGTDSLRKRASRHIPQAVKRAVWARDRGHCAFASADGRRCTERTFLEYHHLELYARGGPATVENIALRCWRHNQYEGELIFGTRRTSTAREGRPPSTVEPPGP